MTKLKSVKELKQLGLCLTKEEQKNIKGGESPSLDDSPASEQYYFRDTGVKNSNNTFPDRERCARVERAGNFGSTGELIYKCVRV